jgi:hypothetical protein
MENQFCQCTLKKYHDPEIWITELKDLCMKHKKLGSSITDNQFMTQILSNMTWDYYLQLAIMANISMPKSNLLLERLIMKENEECDIVGDLVLFYS